MDGTNAGDYQAQPYMALESGVLPKSAFSDIADAIRGQNGLSTLYAPKYLTHATFAADMATYAYLNSQYLPYSATSLASVSGLGNLSGVRSMRFMFASCAMAELDFRGFDPSTLTNLHYAFSVCKSLARMYADSTWALPTGRITGSQRFYSCSANLVGGNGTVWSTSNTSCTYFRIDAAGTPGYLTSA